MADPSELLLDGNSQYAEITISTMSHHYRPYFDDGSDDEVEFLR